MCAQDIVKKMEFIRRSAPGRTVALFPGTFNPPTVAHQALLEAVLAIVEECVVVLPRSLPHKTFDGGASLEQRLAMLERLDTRRAYSIAVAEQGLFVDMSEEFRRNAASAIAELYIVTGRDAAERMLTWDYGGSATVDQMFERFHLLVAARRGEFTPPAEYRHRVHSLDIDPAHDTISSTLVRDHIRRGSTEWRKFVPADVAPLAETIYKR
jgi:cytidyltransferase-like protein